MSLMSGHAPQLEFYLSSPMPCPYLAGRLERKLFTRLTGDGESVNAAVNGTLCRAGFRRSHDVVYRPACDGCNACIPVRIAVRDFIPSRSLRRVTARNRDLSWHRAPSQATAELFDLFTAYQLSRHGDSDMAHMTRQEFAAMLEEGRAGTHLYLARNPRGALEGCMIADPVGDGLSAVYSFFATDDARRSLGTHMILSLIREVEAQGLAYVYLGYWVEGSPKMAYKARFMPLQILTSEGWHAILPPSPGTPTTAPDAQTP